jgi:hypothetical protein
MAGRPEVYVVWGLPRTCVCARDRTPNRGGGSSGGREPQESTDGRLQPGQVMKSSLNGLPGGAKLRSGRAGRLPASPVSVGCGRYVRLTSVCRGDRTSDRREPSSWLMSPGSTFGWARVAKSWRDPGESGREDPAGAAPAAVGERTRKEATARESGCGSPGRESSGGALQGRERHERRPRSVGGHGERRGPKDLERAASQPEPSRGARTLRTAPTRVWRSSSHVVDREGDHGGEGAPDVVVFEGARTSREADPQGPGTVRLLLEGAGPAKGRAGGGRELTRLLGGSDPKREARGTHVPRQGPTRNTPRSSRRRGGSAGSQ